VSNGKCVIERSWLPLSPGKEFNEGLAAVIAGKLDVDLYVSVRKLAQSMGIAASTVCRYLIEALRMKCRYLRWVPHALTQAQKVMGTELAQRMLQALAKNEHLNYHFLFTDDESDILWL
jgi:hypothetical protein